MMRPCFAFVLAIAAFVSLQFTASAQSKSRSELLDEIKNQRAELDRLEKEFLGPSDSDRARYADLLGHPQTGMIRLLPREKYDTTSATSVPTTLSIRGNGSYYSFARLTHEYGLGSDISLEHGLLSVGFAGVDHGMLINIGNVDLLEITIDSPYAAALARYQPVQSVTEARIEKSRMIEGTTLEGLDLKNRLPVTVNATYLLRSIVYGRSDVLVAFKVVRRDSDDSIVIAWKMLKNNSKPRVARN